MSWSVQLIGSPENISKELQEQSKVLTGKSKEEFDEALPYMVGLVNQNYNKEYPLILQLSASGHGYEGYNQCSVSIGNLGGKLV